MKKYFLIPVTAAFLCLAACNSNKNSEGGDTTQTGTTGADTMHSDNMQDSVNQGGTMQDTAMTNDSTTNIPRAQ